MSKYNQNNWISPVYHHHRHHWCTLPSHRHSAKYPDSPNFCHRRKSAGKFVAAVNAAKFLKFGHTAKTSANLRLSLPFLLSLYTPLTDFKTGIWVFVCL